MAIKVYSPTDFEDTDKTSLSGMLAHGKPLPPPGTRRQQQLVSPKRMPEGPTLEEADAVPQSVSSQQRVKEVLQKYSKSLSRIFKHYASRCQVTSKDHSFGDVQNQTGLMALSDWSKCMYDFGFGTGLLNRSQKKAVFQKHARPGMQGVRLGLQDFVLAFADAADLALQSTDSYRMKYPTKDSRVEALFVRLGMHDTHVLRWRLKINFERHAAAPVPNPMEVDLPNPPAATSNPPLPRVASKPPKKKEEPVPPKKKQGAR